MDLKFCEKCHNLMDFCLENIDETLGGPIFICSQCSHKQPFSNDEITVQLKKKTNVKEEKNTNEYFQLDPTLPYITNKTIECVNEDCPSKTTSKKEIKFIKYDEVNLKYMYLCCVCGQKWTNEID
jgi:DNA-directed RNA polymerase subunit M/transcription elongation factor TFIIS